jgi:hypothetical protein
LGAKFLMASLTERNGQGYINRDDDKGWVPLSNPEYAREQIYQNHIQGQSAIDRGLQGAQNYTRETLSGLDELLGGAENAREEQQFRRDQQQQNQSFEDFGGFAGDVGAFGAGASTALIPGKLPVQMLIGGVQGAAETPDSPAVGAGFGSALTFVGDYAADALGRMGRQLFGKRTNLVDEATQRSIARGEAEGLQFTPGQRTGDPSRRMLEKQLAKNPRTAGIDAQRFMNNQAALNDAAARTLGLQPTGRLTPTMRGQAVDSVSAAFDDIAENTAPIDILGGEWIKESHNLTADGGALMERFINKYPGLFKGDPIDGPQFNQARNWLAEQSRRVDPGVASEMQPFMRIMDDSLEAANVDLNPMMVDNIRRARQKWKALLVIEHAQRGAGQAAGGNIGADSAYQALRKYDKGGIYRGRQRDAFSNIVDAMAATGDNAPTVMPSQGGTRGITQTLMDQLYTGPAAEMYMKGSPWGEAMLGVMGDSARVPGVNTAGQATARGLMGLDDDDEQPGR